MASQSDTCMSRMEELHLQRELKQVILEYIGILYNANHPNHHGFALLICRHRLDSRAPAVASFPRHRTPQQEYVMVRAIVYTEATHQMWRLVAESSKSYFSITPALQEFSRDLERQMGDMTAVLSLGEKRSFHERDGDVYEDDASRKKRR